ncbi:MAG: single-stranded DNA-binding protein [Leptospiraceae bacterium]|nr:single-stranded DNA-binding protein [Leptospiraceae bacterium]
MAGDVNKVVLIGRLTRDPELRQTQSGTSYARFSIANNRMYVAGGERREEVSFFNCVAWGRQAEVINQYCRKGKQVAIEGRLQQRSWENQEGKKQSVVDVVVEQLQMLGSPGDGGGSGSSGDGAYGSESRSYAPAQNSPPSYDDPMPYDGGGMEDDDIPF